MRSPVSFSISCADVLRVTGGTMLQGEPTTVFTAVGTDSREALPGGLFVPLRGKRFDGHEFLAAAVANGAAGVLAAQDAPASWRQLPAHVPVVGVADTLQALGDLAAWWRRCFDIPVVAVTGSCGKTTTKEMIAAIAGGTRHVLKTEGTRNNLVGLPLTLLQLSAAHELAVLELGTNQPGEIARLTAIAAPDVGLITNIGSAHMEGFGSPAAIRTEKLDLFVFMRKTGTAIINLDDVVRGGLGSRWHGKKVTFALRRGSLADVTATDVRSAGVAATAFTLRLSGVDLPVTISAAGEHNVANALAAAATTLALGCDACTIAQGLAAFRPVAGRMEVIRLANGAFLVDDTYNANPDSLCAALATLAARRGAGAGIVVLGDMLELGEMAERFHRESGAAVAAIGAAALFLRGHWAGAVAAGAIAAGMEADRIHSLARPEDILPYLRYRVREGDWILVKGSRGASMEEITMAIRRAVGTAPAAVAGDIGSGVRT